MELRQQLEAVGELDMQARSVFHGDKGGGAEKKEKKRVKQATMEEAVHAADQVLLEERN